MSTDKPDRSTFMILISVALGMSIMYILIDSYNLQAQPTRLIPGLMPVPGTISSADFVTQNLAHLQNLIYALTLLIAVVAAIITLVSYYATDAKKEFIELSIDRKLIEKTRLIQDEITSHIARSEANFQEFNVNIKSCVQENIRNQAVELFRRSDITSVLNATNYIYEQRLRQLREEIPNPIYHYMNEVLEQLKHMIHVYSSERDKVITGLSFFITNPHVGLPRETIVMLERKWEADADIQMYVSRLGSG